MLLSARNIDDQRLELHENIESFRADINEHLDSVCIGLDKAMLAKRSRLHEQLEKLATNHTRLSVHAKQVRALLECKDYARAVYASEEFSAALQVFRSAKLPMRPVSEANMKFVLQDALLQDFSCIAKSKIAAQ